ncbi:hypothetical protein FF38_09009, partial [Lucilia cuprina]
MDLNEIRDLVLDDHDSPEDHFNESIKQLELAVLYVLCPVIDHGYLHIGGSSCVGMTGNWGKYPWAGAILLASSVGVFLIDAYCDYFADIWYGVHSHSENTGNVHRHNHRIQIDSREDRPVDPEANISDSSSTENSINEVKNDVVSETKSVDVAKANYYAQFAGFLVLEFGVVFHSVIIGLTLEQLRSNSGADFRTIGVDPKEDSFVEVGVEINSELVVFKRTASDFFVNDEEVEESVYVEKWKSIGILPQGQNSVVLQGAVESLSKGSPSELAALVESTSPSNVSVFDFDNLKHQIEDAALENQHKTKSRNAAQAQVDKLREAKHAKHRLNDAREKLRTLETRREILASKEKQAMISGLKKQV